MRSRKASIYALLAALPLLALDLVFFFRNMGFPGWSDAAYFNTARDLNQAHQYVPGGLEWRPVLHPLFGSLALTLTGGKALASIALASGTFYFAFLMSSALLLSELLPPLEAAFATAFLGSIPWIFHLSMGFSTEIYFLAFGIFSAALFLRSKDLRDRSSAVGAGISLGLAACCDPTEAILVAGPILAAYLLWLLRRRVLRWSELAWPAASVGCSLAFFFFAQASSISNVDGLIPAFLLCQGVLAAAYLEVSAGEPRPFFIPFLIAQIIPLSWFSWRFENIGPFVWTGWASKECLTAVLGISVLIALLKASARYGKARLIGLAAIALIQIGYLCFLIAVTPRRGLDPVVELQESIVNLVGGGQLSRIVLLAPSAQAGSRLGDFTGFNLVARDQRLPLQFQVARETRGLKPADVDYLLADPRDVSRIGWNVNLVAEIPWAAEKSESPNLQLLKVLR